MKTPSPLSSMEAWIDENQSQWLEEFYTFLRFPSVSSEKEHQKDILHCGEWISDYLKKIQFHVESWETPGHPVIFASYMEAGPQKPTLLIYNHYDVQPVDPMEEWVSPPFEPEMREGEIFARGAQDNKGQFFYVLQALKYLIEQTGSLPINVKLCIEGEEEIASAGLDHILQQKKDQLQADYLAIVDMGLRQANRPALTLGVRGIITLDVEVKGSSSDLHSGSHGGIVYNPIHALVELLASLRDDQGRIVIPNFYNDVENISSFETSKISLDFDHNEYLKDIGAHATGGEKEYPVLERAWTRPTIEVNGINGGYSGTGFKTVIPAKAYAKISCRLVPNQQPKEVGELVAAYLRKHAPSGMEVTVKIREGHGKAVRVSPDSNIVKAFSKAFEDIFDSSCEYIYSGGSIPIIPELAQASGGETILLGLGLPTDQIHAPNEHFGLDRLKKGMLVIARALEILSQKKGQSGHAPDH